ncbi:MAG: multiple sugar transport system substrate-binding protein [Hyphomicrobiales bacterium]|jgi:multiple sugar transport system substrate-binding protein|nr:multiple sugar transport system substrate-binding protein [Hyphomicrobiales bacterium]
MKNNLISRRAVLAGTAAGAFGLSSLPAHSQVNWKKYAGTKLEAILAKGPRGDNFQKHIKEFTELTGIQVESEQIPEQQQRQKCVIELASGKPSFDVVHLSYHVQKRQFEKAGWLADLTPFMKDPNLTAPDLKESDFSAAGLSYSKNDKGQMLSLPWSVDYFILYYNKEIFQKAGVQVPKTLDEMNALAEKLTDAKAGINGYVGRGLKNANMTLWTNYFLNYGGEFLDAKGNILTDGPEAVAATKSYVASNKSSPPGVAGFNWMEALASFAQGRAAMWIDGVGWAPGVENPNSSRVVGKVGYAMVPAGPKGQYSATYGDGIGIPAACTKKEAAYLLCQWVVSKTQGARLVQAGGGVPFRNSVLDDPEVQKGVTLPKEWFQSVLGAAKISKLGLPVIIPVAEFRDLVGAAVTATLSGADPATELKKAHEQFRPILERSEKA